MSKFFIPKRYDENMAEEGVWFEVFDENDNFYGSFKLRFLDNTTNKTHLEAKRLMRKYKIDATGKGKRSDAEKAAEATKFARVIFCEMILCGWKLPKDANDLNPKESEYTVEDGIEYFEQAGTEHVMVTLNHFAEDPTNFIGTPTADAKAEVEDTVKN